MTHDIKLFIKYFSPEAKVSCLEISNNLSKTPTEYAIINRDINTLKLIFDDLTVAQTKILIKGNDKQADILKNFFQYEGIINKRVKELFADNGRLNLKQHKRIEKAFVDNNILDFKQKKMDEILKSSTFDEQKARSLFPKETQYDIKVNEVKDIWVLNIENNNAYSEISKEILENFERARAKNR